MARFFLFILSFIIGVVILKSPQLHNLIINLGNFELIGAFVAGFFFIMALTVIPGAAVLITLSETMNPFLLSLIAGLGGMCGDYLLMRFFRSESDQLVEAARARRYKNITKMLHSRLLHWAGPVIGTIIIASPFPDEIGITLLGISKLETKKFLALTLILDIISVLFIITVGRIFL